MEQHSAVSAPGGAHILVGLSSSPSNARIVRTAAGMARAFGGKFTALYVRTPGADRMSQADRLRLEANTRLAEQSGAAVATVYGEDVSYQIAEFARLSGVTTVVVGRSLVTRRHFWSKPTLTEKLTAIAPSLDIHIIPDAAAEGRYAARQARFVRPLLPSPRDLATILLILAAATAIGSLFRRLGFTEANIITVYILGVLLTALFAKSYASSAIASLASVLVFNLLFTEPRLTLHVYEPGYLVTFAIMLLAALITGSLANRLKDQARQSAQAAYRTQVLFDTEQLLQSAQDDDAVIRITAGQLVKLLDRDVIAYPEHEGSLGPGQVFRAAPDSGGDPFSGQRERQAALRAFEDKTRSGASERAQGESGCMYLPIRMNEKVYGVAGIHVGGRPLDPFENSVILSILGECALAIENARNAREKMRAEVMARNEQLRADLLRTISHDLRTPLTSISGNADYLLSQGDRLDASARARIYTDIHDDALWLISIVENLLAITRIGEGNLHLHLSVELVEEVIGEALRHVSRRRADHDIRVRLDDELLLARMDGKLIVQVLVNLVDNAVKYTPAGSVISVEAERTGPMVSVSVRDDGPGIPDELKPRVFEMFFTGDRRIADSRRSLGLGLALCRAIVSAHGGEITLSDNRPHGCVFTFTLPSGEVKLHE